MIDIHHKVFFLSKYYLGILFYKLTGQKIEENESQISHNHFVTKLSFRHNVIHAANKTLLLLPICLDGHDIHEQSTKACISCIQCNTLIHNKTKAWHQLKQLNLGKSQILSGGFGVLRKNIMRAGLTFFHNDFVEIVVLEKVFVECWLSMLPGIL